MMQCTFNMIFACNINHKGEYDLEYLDIGSYQEESTPMNLVITANEVSDGMNFNNVKSGIITADHDIGELKMNATLNGVDLSHHENEGERINFSLDEEKEERKSSAIDEKKWGKSVNQNMVLFNRLELGDQNATQMNKKNTVVSLQYASGEKFDNDYMF